MSCYDNLTDNVLIEQNIFDNSELLSYVNEHTYLVYYPEISNDNEIVLMFQLQTKQYFKTLEQTGQGMTLAKDVQNIFKYKTAKAIRNRLYPILEDYQPKVKKISDKYREVYNSTHKLQDLVNQNRFCNLLNKINKKGGFLEPLNHEIIYAQESYIKNQLIEKLIKQINTENHSIDLNSIKTKPTSFFKKGGFSFVPSDYLNQGKLTIENRIYQKLIQEFPRLKDNQEKTEKTLNKFINDTFDKGEIYFLEAFNSFLENDINPMQKLFDNQKASHYSINFDSKNVETLDNKLKPVLNQLKSKLTQNNQQALIKFINAQGQEQVLIINNINSIFKEFYDCLNQSKVENNQLNLLEKNQLFVANECKAQVFKLKIDNAIKNDLNSVIAKNFNKPKEELQKFIDRVYLKHSNLLLLSNEEVKAVKELLNNRK